MRLSGTEDNHDLPCVSVIVPAHNSSRSIRQCLDSLLESEYPRDRMELICVDNASTDHTSEILDGYSPVVKIVHESKCGPAAARNAGLRVAAHPIAAFTDSDCVVDSAWLRRIVAPLTAGHADAVGGRILARPQAGPVELFGEMVHDHARAIEYYRPPYLITMNLATRVDLLRSIGCFDERWIRMEDVDLTYRLLKAGARISYQCEAVVRHHNRDRLTRLAREGFLHGYHRAEFLRAHRDFIARYRERHSAQPPPESPRDQPPAASRLKPWQIGLFWRVFNSGKRAGEITGQWFPVRRV